MDIRINDEGTKSQLIKSTHTVKFSVLFARGKILSHSSKEIKNNEYLQLSAVGGFSERDASWVRSAHSSSRAVLSYQWFAPKSVGGHVSMGNLACQVRVSLLVTRFCVVVFY